MPAALTDFVPADIDASRWPNVEPLFEELATRQVSSREEFERWLLDRSELEAACSEAGARLYIDMTCNTEDEALEQKYLAFVREVEPKLKPAGFRLDRRQVELEDTFGLDPERYLVLGRDTRSEVELFRDENVPIQTELSELAQKQQKLTGAMTVEFDGREQTLPQMARYQESTDRAVREGAWRAVAERRLRDRDAIDEIYDRMVEKRTRLARNAGFENYVGYAFKAKKRFDYTPAHCAAFHDAVEREVMPFAARLDERRRALLGVDELRPWDVAVDPKGRPPLRPFENGVDLVSKTRRVFDRLDPSPGGLGEMFAGMGDGSNDKGIAAGALLDLDSRRGKAPGGYQYMQDRSRRPFIFMNAAGLHRDVETMVHEAGHAFHSMLCVDEPLLHYRHAPIEFAEVASMSMELLTMPYWDAYYPDAEDLARARRRQLEGSVVLLAWIATIDAFQHWVYSNPGHTREERTAEWLRLGERFGDAGHRVSWEGLEPYRRTVWQRQGHLFGAPFYYIEYGIAQLGALGLWLKSLEEGEQAAVAAYKRAMSLGGSKPLPELFAAAGLEFDFGAGTVGRIVRAVEAELDKLPD